MEYLDGPTQILRVSKSLEKEAQAGARKGLGLLLLASKIEEKDCEGKPLEAGRASAACLQNRPWFYNCKELNSVNNLNGQEILL